MNLLLIMENVFLIALWENILIFKNDNVQCVIPHACFAEDLVLISVFLVKIS